METKSTIFLQEIAMGNRALDFWLKEEKSEIFKRDSHIRRNERISRDDEGLNFDTRSEERGGGGGQRIGPQTEKRGKEGRGRRRPRRIKSRRKKGKARMVLARRR